MVLPGSVLQLPPDRLGQADVVVADRQLDSAQTAQFERDEEFTPEDLALAVSGDIENWTSANSRCRLTR